MGQRGGSEDLAVKDAPKVFCGGIGGSGQCWLSRGIGFEFEGGDTTIGDAAGDDPAKIAQIGGDVECEAVRSDAGSDVNADGGNLFLCRGTAGVGPDAGSLADALGGDAEVFAGENECLFDEANEVDGAEVWAAFAGKIAAEVEDRVTDELTGAVVGDVATTVDFVNLDASASEELVGGEDVGTGGVAAEGENGRMLHEQEGVAEGAGFAGRDDLLHDPQTFGVGDAAELKQMEDLHVNLMEMNLRTASCSGLATVKLKVMGPLDAEGCVELTCVETVTEGRKQMLVFSDEKSEPIASLECVGLVGRLRKRCGEQIQNADSLRE